MNATGSNNGLEKNIAGCKRVESARLNPSLARPTRFEIGKPGSSDWQLPTTPFNSDLESEFIFMAQPTKIGIMTVSDRASRGEYQDLGGPAIAAYLDLVICSPFTVVAKVIPDDVDTIEASLIELCDNENCSLVVTTGGTGPAIRDVTPEATERVCDKLLPGFGELMRSVSLQKVATAILSRQTAGIRSRQRGGSLILNLPGNPKAIAECLDAVFAAIPYCIDLIGGPFLETNPERIRAFRPKQK